MTLTPELLSALKELSILGSIDGLLGWDQQVNLPSGAGEFRGEQLELMSRLIHSRITSPRLYELLQSAANEKNLSDDERVTVTESLRHIDRQRALPAALVAERAAVQSNCFLTWQSARPKGDFKAVTPFLTRLVELNRTEAELLRPLLKDQNATKYDALLDNFEPGIRFAVLEPLFASLAERLRTLVSKLTSRFSAAPEFSTALSVAQQQALSLRIATDIGYDLNHGRLDTAAHPFQSTVGRGDVRMTTHYYPENFLSALYSTLHETGHALYELGLPREHFGTPLGQAISLGVHESQSRFWENIVGRSKEYCRYLAPLLAESGGPKVSFESLWKGVNRVQPSLIRIEADEVTYSLHVTIRMLLEEAVIEGRLAVPDLPDAWDELYLKYLGIKAPSPTNGVMQDVHWYSGSMGYFPTYVLGNLYGAMFTEALERELGPLSRLIEQKQFSAILGWFRKNVHQHGMRYHPPELLKKATGQSLSAEPFLKYLERKFEY